MKNDQEEVLDENHLIRFRFGDPISHSPKIKLILSSTKI